MLPHHDAGKLTEEIKERERRRKLEQAQKRFQFVTKEVDWRVAKAYVTLADGDDDESHDDGLKEDKEGKDFLGKRGNHDLGEGSGEGVEGRAVDRYLDDDEWENGTGGKVNIQRFPGSPEQNSSSRSAHGSVVRGAWFRK